MFPDISEYFSWFLYPNIIKPRRTLSTEPIQKKDTLITAAICCSIKVSRYLSSPYPMYIQHPYSKVLIQKIIAH